jgi:hypothetical protein
MSDPSCNEKKVHSSIENADVKCKTYANVGILIMVIIGVWVLFLVPIILFGTRPVENVSLNIRN